MLTGDGVVHANKIRMWKKQLHDVADTVLARTMFREEMEKIRRL